MLKPGRTFYLWDAMWSFDAPDTAEPLPAWIAAAAKPVGEGFTNDAANFPTPWHGEFFTTRNT